MCRGTWQQGQTWPSPMWSGIEPRESGSATPTSHACTQQPRTTPKLAITFLRVAGMLDPPETLFRPDIVLRVLSHTFRLRNGSTTADADGDNAVRLA